MRIVPLPIALLLILATAPASLGQTGYRPQVGQPHPEMVLPRIDTRESVSLSQYRGKKVLLMHFASW